jgi:hypothetical protein
MVAALQEEVAKPVRVGRLVETLVAAEVCLPPHSAPHSTHLGINATRSRDTQRF